MSTICNNHHGSHVYKWKLLIKDDLSWNLCRSFRVVKSKQFTFWIFRFLTSSLSLEVECLDFSKTLLIWRLDLNFLFLSQLFNETSIYFSPTLPLIGCYFFSVLDHLYRIWFIKGFGVTTWVDFSPPQVLKMQFACCFLCCTTRQHHFSTTWLPFLVSTKLSWSCIG